MKTIIAIATLLAGTFANAQELAKPAKPTIIKMVPAVKKTATIQGESFAVTRDENGKIVFVKVEIDRKFISPILIRVEEPENTQK